MKVDIYATPRFTFDIERGQVEHLQMLARNHYDAFCRTHCTEMCVTAVLHADFMDQAETRLNTVHFDLTFRGVDTFAKLVVMRVPGLAHNDWQDKFATALRVAMEHSNKISVDWKGGIETEFKFK